MSSTKMRILFVLGSTDDCSVPHQWATLLRQKGENVQVHVRAISDTFMRSRFVFILATLYEALFKRYDAVHINHTLPATLIPLIRLFAPRATIVLSVHRSFSFMSSLTRFGHVIGGLAADVVSANSAATAESIQLPILRRKVTVILNGVNLNEFPSESEIIQKKLNADAGSLNIVAVGRLIPEKNFSALLDAVSRINKSGEFNAKLTVVGHGPLLASLKGKCADLGIEKDVTFMGLQPRREVYSIVSRSSLMVVPSLTEGFCNAAVEAMALGTPVIYTPVGALPEVIGDGGIACADCSAEAIQAAIQEFCLLERVQKEGMVKRARSKVERELSMQRAVEEFITYYQCSLSIT